jgi:hypothetical protein
VNEIEKNDRYFIIAFADQYGNSGWYMVAGLIMVVFGTWGGILLVTSKK